ncbi:MAG TPA: SGNH/GDSL hydrolase family protein [Gammaproteobacteria bacterium]|nr:SGNH/GDSL hydrolase family protein [Gammaproteobacteria bacterium]
MNKRSLLLYLAALVCMLGAGAADAAWIGSWGASPLPPTPASGRFAATPSFHDQTIRQIVRLSAGGDRVRLRLTNEYGTQPLEIGAASIAIVDADGEIRAGSERKVTFDGKPGATIPAGAPYLSDPIDLAVEPLTSISVSLYLPGDTGPCTCHSTGRQTAYISKPGNFTTGSFEPAKTMQSRAFLSGVAVETAGRAHVIVALGDSITDGVGSMLDANRRWPDDLAERLAKRKRKGVWGVVNEGISGNRILRDGAGESALARFDRDVLAVPGVSGVIVFEGINDIGLGFGSFGGAAPAGGVTADSLIAGLEQIIARAHAKGLRIYGATITPYKGAAYYSEQGEAVREAVNQWIRKGGEFDGVLDFDAVLRDPADPKQIAQGLHAGDHLHGSDKGYRALADSVNLGLFTK